MNTTADINYIYPNYDIAHGGVKDGLIRIAKIDMSIEIYWHGSWHKCTTYQTPPPADEIIIADAGGYYSSDNVEGVLQEIGAALDDVETELSGSYLTFSSVTNNQVTFAGTETLPVAVLTNAGHLYPIEKGSLIVDTVNNTCTVDVTPYLAYDNAASFSGTWRVYFSAGSSDPGDDIATLTGTAITPKHGAVYVHELAADDTFTIDSTGLSASKQVTFELHLIQPSTAVSFTLPNTLIWADGDSFASTNTAPDMSTADTEYCIVIRWDGSDLLANLAYTKAIEVPA